MLSKKAKYALKALIALTRSEGEGPLRIQDIAVQEHIPRKFLELILLDLRNRGILQSTKGPGGGYTLGQPADRVTVGQVVRLFDGPLAPVPCASQTAYAPCADCPDEAACRVRWIMKQVRDATADLLDHTTLETLARQPSRRRRA